MTAEDRCGSDVIASTMLTLSPGELSTIIGGPAVFPAAWKGNGIGVSATTKPFDFRDLPCPPQSVMVDDPPKFSDTAYDMLIVGVFQEENWWKPAEGDPYRPLLAPPDQIKSLRRWWTNNEVDFFTGKSWQRLSNIQVPLYGTNIKTKASIRLGHWCLQL